jgi:CubicO group peptidase (beta-lactamase class C family)
VSDLDRLIRDAVEQKAAPFLCAAVGDSRQTLWQSGAGSANPGHEAGPDTVFRLFSATKAIGSVAALIAIDRGMFTMDTPVGDIVPGFDELQVLTSVTSDGPVFRRSRSRATLRHLLTHTQGQGYDVFYKLMIEYRERSGAPDDLTGLLQSLEYPLMFDPGEGFAYGIGIDWVGMMIATADGRPIEQFVQEEILDPLGMTSTVFEVQDVSDRLAELSTKTQDGNFEAAELAPPSRPEFYHMGYALYSTTTDYLKFLRCLLNRGELDGTRIVSRESMELACTDQMAGIKLPTPILTSQVPSVSFDVDILPEARFTHTAVAFMNVDSVPGRRGSDSLSWGGVLHTLFWVDPGNDLAGVFFTQMLPFWEPGLMAVFEEFERIAYREFVQ